MGDRPTYGELEKRVWELERAESERMRVEEALQASEKNFRSLFESMASGCCIDELVYDNGKIVDYKILDVNPSYVRIMGIERDRAIGSLGSQIYSTGFPPLLDIFTSVSETGKPASFETYFAPAEKFLHFTVSCPAKGLFPTVFSDITERKKRLR